MRPQQREIFVNSAISDASRDKKRFEHSHSALFCFVLDLWMQHLLATLWILMSGLMLHRLMPLPLPECSSQKERHCSVPQQETHREQGSFLSHRCQKTLFRSLSTDSVLRAITKAGEYSANHHNLPQALEAQMPEEAVGPNHYIEGDTESVFGG